MGGIALVTTLLGLIITDLIFDGFSIEGFWTWIAATVIVWLGGLLAAFVLPLIFLKNRADERNQPAAAQGRHLGALRSPVHSQLPAHPQPAPRLAGLDVVMQNTQPDPHDEATLDRRRALRLLGGAGLGLGVISLAGRGAFAASGADSTIPTATAEIPDETGGPFPGDGTNGVNVLAEDGVVRSDITSSFGSASGVADGIPCRWSSTSRTWRTEATR